MKDVTTILDLPLDTGRTIGEEYELIKASWVNKDWRIGKGRAVVNGKLRDEVWWGYKGLWKQYFDEHPGLLDDIKDKARGKVLTDKFASSDISQARAIAEILNESNKLRLVGSVKAAVIQYGDWVINSWEPRAAWIRDQIRSGVLRGRPLVYYKELGEPSHANMLDYLINRYDWERHEKTADDIYSELGSQTISGNVVLCEKVGLDGQRYADSIGGVYTLRLSGTDEHYGNPFTDRVDLVKEYQYRWSRYDRNGYEVSTAGDKRFSALVARLSDGRTIEEAYQLDVKGYRNYMTVDQRERVLVDLLKKWVSANGADKLKDVVVHDVEVDGISQRRLLSGIGIIVGAPKLKLIDTHIVQYNNLHQKFVIVPAVEYNRELQNKRVMPSIEFSGSREECLLYVKGVVMRRNPKLSESEREMAARLCDKVIKRSELRKRVSNPLPSELNNGIYFKNLSEFRSISKELGLMDATGNDIVKQLKR